MQLEFDVINIPSAALHEPGELILDSGGGRTPTPDESQLLGLDGRHAQRPPTALPYRYQDSYGRETELVAHRVATLSNDRISATFLLDQGGKLWSLRDLTTGREVLHQPSHLQFANLAIRNAWVAGGVEWNLGVTGHWGLTCEPVCAGTVNDGQVLRMWAHERLLGITWRLDAWLPEGSDALFTHVVVANPTDRDRPVYWWSNIAVPQTEHTRVLIEAQRAFHFGYADALSEVDVPLRDGDDISYPQRHCGSADYFYLTPNQWIAAVDENGRGLGQASTSPLIGRKLFTWGDGSGGRSWQRWLSGDGAYAEIQAGLARTQLEHLRLPSGASLRFTESYRPISIGPQQGWTGDVARARTATVHADELAEADLFLTGIEREIPQPQPATPAMAGWGALEVAAGHRHADPATPFPHTFDDEQLAWLRFAETGLLSDQLQTSALIGPEWTVRLERAERGWLRDLLLGYARHAAGETVAARELWAASVAEHPTPDAHRALALTTDDPCESADGLAAAHRLAPTRRGIAVEAAAALAAAGRHKDALTIIDGLPPELSGLPRLQYLECLARVETGDAKGAAALLALPLVLPDLREGDVSLDQLWDKHQALVGGTQPLPAYYDFRMQSSTEENHGSD